MKNPRGFIQRACVILGLIALSIYFFYIGKGHILLLDTNSVTIGDKEYRSHASATVRVNGVKLKNPMARAERVSVTVSGPNHTIVIIDDANDNRVEKTFSVPIFMQRAIVSIPAILGDAPTEHWITLFTPPSVIDAPVEKMQYQEDKKESTP